MVAEEVTSACVNLPTRNLHDLDALDLSHLPSLVANHSLDFAFTSGVAYLFLRASASLEYRCCNDGD